MDGNEQMKTLYTTMAVALMLQTGAAFADGDVAEGEADFKKCKACHTIASADEVIYKGGKTGPNLYGVIGRVAGSEDFKYGASLAEAGQAGLVWNQENIVEFIADPKSFLKEATGDSGAKSKMTFKMKDAEDVAAYLASVSPAAPEADEENDDS